MIEMSKRLEIYISHRDERSLRGNLQCWWRKRHLSSYNIFKKKVNKVWHLWSGRVFLLYEVRHAEGWCCLMQNAENVPTKTGNTTNLLHNFKHYHPVGHAKYKRLLEQCLSYKWNLNSVRISLQYWERLALMSTVDDILARFPLTYCKLYGLAADTVQYRPVQTCSADADYTYCLPRHILSMLKNVQLAAGSFWARQVYLC